MRKPVCEKKRGSLVVTVVGLVICALVGVIVVKVDSSSTAAAIRAVFIALLACGYGAPDGSDLRTTCRSAKGSGAAKSGSCACLLHPGHRTSERLSAALERLAFFVGQVGLEDLQDAFPPNHAWQRQRDAVRRVV